MSRSQRTLPAANAAAEVDPRGLAVMNRNLQVFRATLEMIACDARDVEEMLRCTDTVDGGALERILATLIARFGLMADHALQCCGDGGLAADLSRWVLPQSAMRALDESRGGA